MQQAFNNKYMDYCRSKDTKEEIFRMTLGHAETLEDYEESLQPSYKRARCTLDLESLNLVLLRGITEDFLENLNMMSGGDIYQLSYDDIKTIFKNHSRASRKKGRDSQFLAKYSSSNTSIKSEIGNMLEDFKSEMFHTLALQMDAMQIERRWEEVERALVISFPRCTRRNPRNECPLKLIEVFLVCDGNHSIDKCASLHGLEVMYQGTEGVTEQPYYIN